MALPIIIAIALIFSWLAFHLWRASQLPVTFGTLDYDDPKVVGAIQNARSSLPYFWDKKSSAINPDDYFVKVRVEDERGSSEHIWVADPAIDGVYVTGIVDSDTAIIKSHMLGDRLRYPSSAITDWMYNEGDLMHGNFTMRVTGKPRNMSQAQYDYLLSKVAPLPTEEEMNTELSKG